MAVAQIRIVRHLADRVTEGVRFERGRRPRGDPLPRARVERSDRPDGAFQLPTGER